MWQTSCVKGVYMVPDDPEGTCHEIPHDTQVLCDGAPCTITARGNWFELTPESPGTVRVHAILTPKDGGSPKDVTLGTFTIERPIRIAPRCDRAPAVQDTDTIVIVDLHSQRSTLLSGGGEIELAVLGGAACEHLPDVDPETTVPMLPRRRFRCPAVGALEVEAKGRDFTARNAVRCP
jgi:hypothetical protein